MDEWSNPASRFRPIEPRSPYILGSSVYDRHITEVDGLFYRSDRPDFEELTAAILDNPSDTSLRAYQYWAEAGWKTEHGTYDSVQRFSGKAIEEGGEFAEAARDFNPGDREGYDELLGEAGDVLWCITALANNGGVDLDRATKDLLYQYLHGIRFIEAGEERLPSWHDVAGDLATQGSLLSARNIGELMKVRFEPTPSPVMNIFESEYFNEEPLNHLTTLFYLLVHMTSMQERQFGYNDTLTTESQFRRKAQELGVTAAQSLLDLTFITYNLTDGEMTLAEIIHHNVVKISGRVQQQLVDKTDGQRPAELL